ncbi:DEAD/DEAH box helicase family protein [uncultured Sutterella sp.]|uniref:DEAD/DEAH box helicase family protein n=1 Tax=uncultured Sutterella sp. TaxID=286133 RepID=UPI0025EB6505|nr:DEAD/DEAH box helicase [uncultured Sutterella sp.]
MPAQALLLREFRAGHPHLICAHGGSGKTTAALLALAEYLNPENDSGLERGRAPRTLIITPGLDVAARLCWRMDALVYPSRVNTFPARPGEDFNRRRRALVGVDFVAGPPRFLERVGDDFGLRLDSVERVIVAYFEYFAVNADELARLKALLGKLPPESLKSLGILSNFWSDGIVKAAEDIVPGCRVFHPGARYQPPEIFERFDLVPRATKYCIFWTDISKLPEGSRILVVVPHRARATEFEAALGQLDLRIINNKLLSEGWSGVSRSLARGTKSRVLVATPEDLRYIPPGTFEYVFVMNLQGSPAVYERIAAFAVLRDHPGEVRTYIHREDIDLFVSLRAQLAADLRFVLRQKKSSGFPDGLMETEEACAARREALMSLSSEERLDIVWERLNADPVEAPAAAPEADIVLPEIPDDAYEVCRPRESHPGEAFLSAFGEALAKAGKIPRKKEAAAAPASAPETPELPASPGSCEVAPGVTVRQILELSDIGFGRKPRAEAPALPEVSADESAAPQEETALSAEPATAEEKEEPFSASEEPVALEALPAAEPPEDEAPGEAEESEAAGIPEETEEPQVPEAVEETEEDDDFEWEEDEDEDSADWEEDDLPEDEDESGEYSDAEEDEDSEESEDDENEQDDLCEEEADESLDSDFGDEDDFDDEGDELEDDADDEYDEDDDDESEAEDVSEDVPQPHRRTLTIRSDYRPSEAYEPTVTITEPLSSNTVELRAAQDRMRRAMKGGEKLTHQMVGKRGTIRQSKRRREEPMPEMEGILPVQPGAKRPGQKKFGRGTKDFKDNRRNPNATRLRKPQNQNQKRRTRLVKDVPAQPERDEFRDEALTVPLAADDFPPPQEEGERAPRKRREKFRKAGGPNLRTPFKKRRGPSEKEDLPMEALPAEARPQEPFTDAASSGESPVPAVVEKKEDGGSRRRRDFFKKKKTPRLAKPKPSQGFPTDDGFEDDDNFGNSIHYRPRQPKKSSGLPWQSSGSWGNDQPTTLSFAQTTPAEDFDRTGMRTVYGSTPPLDGMKHDGGKKKFGKFRKSGNFKKKFGARPPRKPRSE